MRRDGVHRDRKSGEVEHVLESRKGTDIALSAADLATLTASLLAPRTAQLLEMLRRVRANNLPGLERREGASHLGKLMRRTPPLQPMCFLKRTKAEQSLRT